MPTESAPQQRPSDQPTPDATGVYLPPAPDPAAALNPGEATVPEATGCFVPAPEPAGEGTGVYVPPPPPPDATADLGTGAPDATGVYVPQPAQAPDHPPAPDATGVYVPGATGATPGEETGGAASPDATGAYVPGGTNVAKGQGTAAAGEGGATGAYTPGQAPPTDATGAYDPEGRSTFTVRIPGPEPDEDEVRCGHYVLRRFHAKGGMGEIYVAEDPAIGRTVALKRMLGRRRDQQDRFLVEAQVTGQLEHPGIVPVHELGTTEDGQPYYVMKFVRGRTLKKVMEEYHAAAQGGWLGEVEQVRLLQSFLALTQTVAYAHSRGVLHRDLKPENVMLGPYGETLLLDWGIAKVLGQPDTPVTANGDGDAYVQLQGTAVDTGTQAGAILGSPSYMAPEVAAGLNDEVDQRSDVYLLGATLYEMLTGRVPRQAKTVMELVKKAQREPPLPLRKVNALIPRPLEAICLKAMAHRQDDRYPSALDLAEDVQRYLAGEPVSAYRENFWERTGRWVRKHKKALWRSAAAVVLLAAGVAAFALVRDAQERGERAEREAEELRLQEQARQSVARFRRLADETRYYAATTDRVAENSPYFDPRKGEATGREALIVAERWGPGFRDLPLAAEREPAKKELYDLLLLLAQVKAQQADKAAAPGALALLQQAAAVGGPSRGYHRLRAEVYRLQGNAGRADAEQRRAEDPKLPPSALDHFLLGEQYRKQTVREAEGRGDPNDWQPRRAQMAKAMGQYRRALEVDPSYYWSHFQLGRAYLSLGQGKEAVEALGACVALRPKSPWGYSARGLALAGLQRYREAEADLSRALKLNADFRPPLLNRGWVYWVTAMQTPDKKARAALEEKALADFEACLKPPKGLRLPSAAYYRGNVYLQRGAIDRAMEDFDLVVREDPDFRPVYLLRARVHAARDRPLQALKDFDAYLMRGGMPALRGPELHARRGRLLRLLYAELPLPQRKRKSGQALLDLALDELDQAAAADGPPTVYDDLGAMRELAGQADEALAAYTRGLDKAPRDVKLLVKRAWLYEALGKHDEARADFATALRVDPTHAEAHSGLGYVRAVQRDAAGAQREADLALVHGGNNYLVLHNVACIYAVLSRGKETGAHQDVALALLRRAVDLWREAGGGLSEIDLMKGEPAFPPALRQRPEFLELLKAGAARNG